MSSDRKQVGWGLVDQGLSSATNFGGSVLAARVLSATEFGGFALGFSLYLLVLGLSRSWSSEPLVVRFAVASSGEQHRAIRDAATMSIVAGSLGGLLLAVAACVFWSSIGSVLLAVGVLLPALMLQDFCRYALILRRRSRDASLNDLLWLLILIATFVAARSHQLTAAVAVICWAAGSIVAGLAGLAQLRCSPSTRVLRWARDQHDLSWRYSTEFLLLSGTALLLTVGLGAVSGLEDAAGFRGAQIALGPLGVLFMGATMQLTPIMARRAHTGGEILRELGRNVSLVLGSAAAAWGILLMVVPDRIGVALLGPSWASTRPLLPIWAAYYVATGLVFGATIGLRACGAARTSLRLRACMAPIALSLGLLGALVGGPKGASVGLLVGNAMALPFWWRAFLALCSSNSGAAELGSASWR